MQKLISKIVIVLFFVLGLFYLGSNVYAEEPDAYLIMTNPADDCSTKMNVLWHSQIPGTYLEYTLKSDTSFNNKKTVFPVEEELEIYDGTTGGNVKDYKCEATILNLEPSTDYIYRVGLNNKSKVHSFKTAGAKEFNFAVVSDIHTYTKLGTRLSKANNIIHYMENDNELSFVLAVGDIMAYGTNRGYWDDFTKSDMVNNYMMAATPGNHDYYNSSANFLDSSYFNAYTNNPDNGSEKSPNTTYYFYYGDVLFISLNSEDACTNSTARENQREWLDKVLRENEKATFKVVYFHRSMYPGSGSNTGHASTMKGAFQDLFDKYGIDLVFGGHDHVYVRTKKILNGKESADSNFGTTYVSLPQIGDRASQANDNMTDVNKKIGGISGAVIVKVSETSMQFSLIDDSNNILDTGSVSSKMASVSKIKVSNGTKIQYDNKFSNMSLTIPESIFQRAYNVKVIDQATNRELLSIRPSYGKTEYKINGISDYQKELKATVEIYYRNGTTYTKDIHLMNDIAYGALEDVVISNNNITFNPNLDGDIIKGIRIITKENSYDLDINTNSFTIPYARTTDKDIIKIQLIAIDDSITDEIELDYYIKQEEVIFDIPVINVRLNDEIIIPLKDIYGNDVPFETEFDNNYVEEKDGKLYGIKLGETAIVIKAVGIDGFVRIVIEDKKYLVTYDYNGGTIVMQSEEVKEVSELVMIKTDNTPTKDGFIFDGWYLDKELTQIFDSKKYDLQDDITLYAKWKPVESEKTGCNKGSIINMLLLIFTSFGTCFIIKKKH